MQHVIDTVGRTDPDLIAAAKRQVTGSVGVIDLRTPEGVMGRVPMEDIVGLFAVEQGELTTYHPNDKHVLFSAHGLVRLPSALHDLIVRELMRIHVEAPSDS